MPISFALVRSAGLQPGIIAYRSSSRSRVPLNRGTGLSRASRLHKMPAGNARCRVADEEGDEQKPRKINWKKKTGIKRGGCESKSRTGRKHIRKAWHERDGRKKTARKKDGNEDRAEKRECGKKCDDETGARTESVQAARRPCRLIRKEDELASPKTHELVTAPLPTSVLRRDDDDEDDDVYTVYIYHGKIQPPASTKVSFIIAHVRILYARETFYFFNGALVVIPFA